MRNKANFRGRRFVSVDLDHPVRIQVLCGRVADLYLGFSAMLEQHQYASIGAPCLSKSRIQCRHRPSQGEGFDRGEEHPKHPRLVCTPVRDHDSSFGQFEEAYPFLGRAQCTLASSPSVCPPTSSNPPVWGLAGDSSA